MRANLPAGLADTLEGARAEAVIRACVHCGMCNAVCPTFQLTGDELDGPRGRIYLMKGALEGESLGPETLLHLDRCLGCRACESACPSGVDYHRLLDVARPFVEAKVGRPWPQKLLRDLIREVTLSPGVFRAAASLGRVFSRVLPQGLRRKVATLIPIPLSPRRPPSSQAERKMTLLAGCVQSASAPHFNAAAQRVFAKVGIDLAENSAAGCCGAVSFHLDAPDQARAAARRNIDAWLAEIDA